jgi:site-specific DNA-methyltransferase (adenine-specific)/modification methylase
MYQLHHGDCLDVLPTLAAGSVDAVICDPPYGMNLETNYKTRKRTALAQCNDFAPIIGDDKPFNPAHLINYPVVVLFGANYFADKLPPCSGWIVWDKLNGLKSKRAWGFNDNSDCELIWTNRPGATRLIPHRWMGMLKESEQSQRRVHPTQKPIKLMELLIERYTAPGATILDPYMGSGTTGVACANTGRNFIGIERDATYFAIAQERIAAAYAPLAAMERAS